MHKRTKHGTIGDTWVKKRKAKKKRKPYFDASVEEAVRLYVRSDDTLYRNKLFEERIHPAFKKIAENVSNIFGVYRIENSRDVISEIVVSLMMNIDKYNPDSGSKAFSYFTVAAKNYVFQIFKKSASKRKFWDNMADRQNLAISGIGSSYGSTECMDPESIMEKKDFLRGIIHNLSGSIIDDEWPNESEVKVVRSVISLLEDNIINKKDYMSIHSRKGVYIYLREMTSMDTKRIARVMSKIRKRYAIYKESYVNGECITDIHKIPIQIPIVFSGST